MSGPPEEETRNKVLLTAGVRRMSPSLFHVPPRPSEASQMVNGGPPEDSIFLSLPPAKNAMKRLSGDQKGYVAPSVPAKGCACEESRGRIHMTDFPSSVAAT